MNEAAAPPACEPCIEDYQCNNNALISGGTDPATITKCDSGFKCITGAAHAKPNLLPEAGTATQWSSADYHLCREGNYCDNTKTDVENNCPNGTYMPRLGAEAETDCVDCPGGYMCEKDACTGATTAAACPGTVTPADCPTGWFCPPKSEG